VQIVGIAEVVRVAGGDLHSLALTTGGFVWAWGYNGYGQLGDNGSTQRTIPYQVPGLAAVAGIAAGAFLLAGGLLLATQVSAVSGTLSMGDGTAAPNGTTGSASARS
jgi:hypothetical protein